jgi:serine/threonine protein kinase
LYGFTWDITLKDNCGCRATFRGKNKENQHVWLVILHCFFGYLSNIYQLTFQFEYYRLKDLPAVEREAAANEVRVLASVVSPQIIKYYDAFVENSRLFIGSWGDDDCQYIICLYKHIILARGA